ncbi:MAG: hypothetical protein GWN18_01675, partial [Thermoplasmata archaeon]|nr:hypothetical protein [Thermoplasmata archaeon]NIS18657.1 hypothetical protein [Thermoplasmata archaeon]NIU47815.1 hypothetical protein [Thermoplasmata archaeon]NIV77461.1 hypothetical protein [Thermoplasmata archaeon]NIW81296.1 hypothetical protein [Thermoplasmata archaeon]
MILGLTDPRGWLSAAVAAGLLVFLPVVTVAQPNTDVDLRDERVTAYVSTIIALAIMGLVVSWLAASRGGAT